MEWTLISPASSSIDESAEFYKKLRFQELATDSKLSLLAEQNMRIELNTNQFLRLGLKLYSEDWEPTLKALEDVVPILELDDDFAFREPNGLWIYLGTNPQENAFETSANESILGNFMGISLEVIDFESTYKIFKVIGYEVVMGKMDSGFVVLGHEHLPGISFMKPLTCPHKFINPSLTFFNGKKNKDLIKKVIETGIEPFEIPDAFGQPKEIENIILRDQGGWGIFMFND